MKRSNFLIKDFAICLLVSFYLMQPFMFLTCVVDVESAVQAKTIIVWTVECLSPQTLVNSCKKSCYSTQLPYTKHTYA